jgi:hypothetical protein
MTELELLELRDRLAEHRRHLLDRLMIDTSDAGFLRLVADLQSAITAVNAQMDVEIEGGVE